MKALKWIIVTVGCTGVKTAGNTLYDSYDSACMMQEILEFQNEYNSYLIYTVDEWERECKVCA